MILKKLLRKFKAYKYYTFGKRFFTNQLYKDCQLKNNKEVSKKPTRTEIINFLLSTRSERARYLEIGVRNPEDNFIHIQAQTKYSVDPGLEFKQNPVDFKMTSDVFFDSLLLGDILSTEIRFDVIFIDGLHLAEQVDRDIQNALNFVEEDGYIVLHDCNPPTEWHAREEFRYFNTPAGSYWNGTTWKAFMKWRTNPDVQSCCVDSDFGVGILSKKQPLGDCITASNLFFEYQLFDRHRGSNLNLINFENLKKLHGF